MPGDFPFLPLKSRSVFLSGLCYLGRRCQTRVAPTCASLPLGPLRPRPSSGSSLFLTNSSSSSSSSSSCSSSSSPPSRASDHYVDHFPYIALWQQAKSDGTLEDTEEEEEELPIVHFWGPRRYLRTTGQPRKMI